MQAWHVRRRAVMKERRMNVMLAVASMVLTMMLVNTSSQRALHVARNGKSGLFIVSE